MRGTHEHNLKSDAVIRRFACLLFASCLLTVSTFALETDQYYSWGRPLADSTDVVNIKLNLELQRSIDSFETSPETCADVAVRFRKRMRFVLFHHIQTWAMHSPLVARIPVDAEEEITYRRTNMYRNHGPFDTGMWMPITPTTRINGVRIGTDKLSHFISSGWTYFSAYRRALKKGKTEHEAEQAALRRGLLEERLILGAAASGITSIADLEASLQGMYFYLGLCSGEDPVLRALNGRWAIRRPVDIREYVHPGWDESYRNSLFTKSRWKKVEPALHQYCDRLDNPSVVEMLHRYRAEDPTTAVQEIIDELVDTGRLKNPDRFSIWTVCDRDPPPFQSDPQPRNPDSGAGRPDDPVLAGRIIADEQDTEGRTVRAMALRVSYPQVVSASIGWIFTSQPAGYDCRTTCDHRGVFAQVEPGLGGGKLSLGWGRVIGEQNHRGVTLSRVFLAMGFKASLLRSWGADSQIPPDQTYLGPEYEFSVARVNMGLGALARIDGDSGSGWIVTGYLGWGF
jgi:hypothetical protein